MRLILDDSWSGMGGIGRFSEEVNGRILYGERVRFSRRPASPLVAFKLSCFFFHSDVVFFPGYIPPLFFAGKYVFTVHDLNHLDRPENSSSLKRFFYHLVVRRGCKKAFCVLTVSEFSKKRIVDWAGIPPEKVINVGNGVGDEFNPDVASFELGAPYYLCVGNRKSHKNEARVVKAFARANISKDISLVFSGSSDLALDEVIQECGLASRVKFMGPVSEEELPSLYKGSRGLLFPSLYEGFGLPVLEAMACGTPVITSNCTSLPEVAGDAAILVDPLETQELSAAIERLENDQQLRSELIARGLERAKLFTWEKTAQKVQEVLDSARNA